ncbi:MAG: TolC family protein [Planctomycetota bacterium]|nr:TolC family protein [Planctomycetota bacterium]
MLTSTQAVGTISYRRSSGESQDARNGSRSGCRQNFRQVDSAVLGYASSKITQLSIPSATSITACTILLLTAGCLQTPKRNSLVSTDTGPTHFAIQSDSLNAEVPQQTSSGELAIQQPSVAQAAAWEDDSGVEQVVQAAREIKLASLPAELPTKTSQRSVGKTTASQTENQLPLNLPSVLATITPSHPVVGFARWRVQEAYADLARDRALWLPTLQAGFSFHNHDGNYQASNGQIVDVNRNSFQYGLGIGGVAAGTTAQPGLIARFHLADAIFLPKVRQKTAWARGHSASATMNRQLLDAGQAYYQLLSAHQNREIVEASQQRMEALAKITIDFAEAGQGLQADADRLRTELALLNSRLIAAQEQSQVASARLALQLSVDASTTLVPMDVSATPVSMQISDTDKASMIGLALGNRPELKEAQALVAAACEAYRREKYAPFVPSVLLGFSTGGFGGGLGGNLANIDNRYDFDAAMTWQVRNFGFGDKAARRQRSAQIQQSRFAKVRVLDQVAADVSEAFAQVEHRKRQLPITQQAIANAQSSFERNLERIQDGQGLPIEVLQSAQALEAAQQAYAGAVIAFNQAELQLQWALGWPVAAPENNL